MKSFENNGYKMAFKATTLFGGVQIIAILISILKSKVIAIWLGAYGYGILSLFSSSIQLIYSITSLGISNSAVRDIAKVNNESDYLQLSKTVNVIFRWIVSTGIIGTLLTVALSSYLSSWFFDNNLYVFSFIVLSVVILLTGISEGLSAIMQGTRNLLFLAKANIYGSVIGFICVLPFYYFLGIKGIVPAIIFPALLSSIISYYFVRKISLHSCHLSLSETFIIGFSTVKLGIMMAISSIALYSIEFIVKMYISKNGGVSDIGLYQAAWTLNTGYLGLVFTAMAKDYFPRLSEDVSNNLLLGKKMNEQAEIALVILSPMIVFMIVFLPFLIKLIYSAEFLDIIPMTRLLLIGSLIKAGSWAISFVFLAKGDGKTFLINELGILLVSLPIYIFSYFYYGLQGIGYGFVLVYIIYFMLVSIIAFKKYNCNYNKEFWKLFSNVLLFSIASYSIISISSNILYYIVGVFIVITSIVYSIFELNKRINIRQFFNK